MDRFLPEVSNFFFPFCFFAECGEESMKFVILLIIFFFSLFLLSLLALYMTSLKNALFANRQTDTQSWLTGWLVGEKEMCFFFLGLKKYAYLCTYLCNTRQELHSRTHANKSIYLDRIRKKREKKTLKSGSEIESDVM